MPFANDTFTDTNGTLLQNHTSSSGHTWSKIAGDTNVTIQSNEARLRSDTNTADDALYVINATPSNANYYVQAVCRHDDSTSTNALVGVVARCDATGANRYQAHLFGGSAGSRGLRLVKSVSGTTTTLGTYLFDWTSNTNYTIRLECVGSTIKVFLNGTERINVTDSSITAAGKAGIRMVALGTSLTPNHAFIDNFEAGQFGDILPAGIPSAEVFGTAKLRQIIKALGISSTEAFGVPKVIPVIRPASIASTEAFGIPKLSIKIRPTGVQSAEVFGRASVFNFRKITSVDNSEITILVDIME